MSISNLRKILVILTGGTICSSTDNLGKRYSNVSDVKIIGEYKKGKSKYRNLVEFHKMMPLDILSENMTIDSWNILLDTFRSEVNTAEYAGIIVLHGTDTLAYTASLLSIALAGIEIPVCLVSSQLPLDYEGTNGHANFRAAVELIMNNIEPNVYAVYRNSDNKIYVHQGAHLLQCANFSQDFFSADAEKVSNPRNAKVKGKAFETKGRLIDKMGRLTASVLRIEPYVGIDYTTFDLKGVRAIVHGTYHSETACVERENGAGAYSKYSILSLLDRCKDEIPLFLAPCSPDAYKYESTGDILAKGAAPIVETTKEMAYVKTLIGCALGLENEKLKEFVNESINYEKIF